MNLYKIVVRNKNGKVLQVHESYRTGMLVHILKAANEGHSATVTRL